MYVENFIGLEIKQRHIYLQRISFWRIKQNKDCKLISMK